MIVLEDYVMLDIKEVMERLELSDSTVRRLVKDGKLRAYRIGVKLKFKPEDLDRYIESQVVQPSKPAESNPSQDAYQAMKRHAPDLEGDPDA